MSRIDEAQLEAFVAPYRVSWERFMVDPWAWASTCVRTRNEDAPPGMPREVLALPNWPHLKVLTWGFYACQYLQVDKSRQLMATWLVCALAVHEAMFFEAANIGYQNMTIEDGTDKLERYMLYVLRNQPLELMMPWIEEREHPPEAWVGIVRDYFGVSDRAKFTPRSDQPASFGSDAYVLAKRLCHRYGTTSGSKGVDLIEFRPFFSASMRRIELIPSGADGSKKWRGMTYTRAILDEAWFHLRLADNVSSAKETVGMYGRMVLISTANPGEDGDGEPVKMIGRAASQPQDFGDFGPSRVRADALPHGVEMWRTGYGFTHVRVWYYAVAERRSREWYVKKVLTGNRRKNQREQLISYDVPSGDPFYESYDPDRQAVPRRPNPHAFLVIGMDGGRRPAAVVTEVLPSTRVVAAFEVVAEKSTSTTALGERLRFQLEGRYGHGWLGRHVLALDPTMFHTRNETNDETSADVLRQLGFNVIEGVQDPDRRFEAVEQANLKGVVDEYGTLPQLVVDSANCPTLHAGLAGGCCLAPEGERANRHQKAKNGYSHIVEALEYALTVIRMGYGRAAWGDEDEDAGREVVLTHQTRRR